MLRNRVKRKIYIRIFTALLVAYLILMIAFSVFMINQQKKIEELNHGATASHINDYVEAILRDYVDDNNQIKDMAKVKNEFMNLLKSYPGRGIETAIYSNDFKLVFQTNNSSDNWLCAYTVNRDYDNMIYANLNPKEYFTEEEINEINKYRTKIFNPQKESDLLEYLILLDGFWSDGDRIIPKNIIVKPVFVKEFDEKGNVKDTFIDEDDINVYTSSYENSKELPYHEAGLVYPMRLMASDVIKNQKELMKMVSDANNLQKVVNQNKYENLYVTTEQVNPVTYRYCVIVPNQDEVGWFTTVNKEQIKTNYGAFWTVVGFQTNLLKQCMSTLVFVWGSCFILFVAAGLFLSIQTYKIYQKREELDRYRTETTNALAHDLKTPLSIISGYAQNLIENIHTEKREYYASNININVNRMDHIIKEMLNLSRYDNEYNLLNQAEIELSQVCIKLVERYSQICKERQITTCLAGNARIIADESLIERVIDNFYVNALEFTPEGGSILIKIAENRLELYNSGSQIPKEIMNEIWQPYKKGDVSRSNKQGTGLGLSIVSKILDLHKFTYGARNVDNGVLFWFQWG